MDFNKKMKTLRAGGSLFPPLSRVDFDDLHGDKIVHGVVMVINGVCVTTTHAFF